jgi:hypothetical protein
VLNRQTGHNQQGFCHTCNTRAAGLFDARSGIWGASRLPAGFPSPAFPLALVAILLRVAFDNAAPEIDSGSDYSISVNRP